MIIGTMNVLILLRRLGFLSVLMFTLVNARAEFVGTNDPGQTTVFSFSLGASATNLSLTVSNNGVAFSHLLLRKGLPPTDTDFDFIAHADGADNRINLQKPELIATNYFLAVRTPTNSELHEFVVTLATNLITMRSETNPVIKPLAGVITGTLAPGAWHYFQVEVVTNIPGWRLVLNATGGGDPDLFVRRGALPNESSADKSSRDRSTDTITFTDAEASPGTYFVGIFLPATAGGNATYTLTTQLGYLTELTWDPGLSHRGTEVFTNQSATGGDYFFKITTQNPNVGVWRTALNVTSGSAKLFLSQSSLPASNSFQFASQNLGSNGFVLHSSQFSAAQDWFILVTATPGAQWTLVTGDAFVQDLGTVTGNGSSGSGNVIMGAEGARYFKTTMPVELLAWRLWLNGTNKDIFVKKTGAPHPLNTGTFDLSQNRQMLVVPDYLVGGDLYFVGVFGSPGETINLDSRLHSFTPLTFNTTTNFSVSGFGYATFRVSVPVEQIAWEIKATPTSGDPNIAVRRNLVPNENNNDAFSEVAAPTVDSLTLVPPNLSDGTFYITVYGSAPYTVSLRNGNPVITDINYVDTRTNDDPSRAGWRYYRVPNIAQQLGTLGWDLFLQSQPPGTEIAIRRNAVPGRWNYRANNSPDVNTVGNVDSSGIGFLQRPGHQADIWYVGIYHPLTALGAFTLHSGELVPAPLSFNTGTQSFTNVPSGEWQFIRVDVPTNALGWDVRLLNVTSGAPKLVVRRGRLPDSLATVIEGSPRYAWYPWSNPSWPSGYQWAADADWSALYYSSDGQTNESGRVLAMGLGNPLEPGTYYVGVIDGSVGAPMNYTVQSRSIGAALTIPVTDLTYSNGVVTRVGLPAREAAYFRVVIPSNAPSWQVKLTPTNGEASLLVQKDALPNVVPTEYNSVTSLYGGRRMRKIGNDHFVLLPANGESNLLAGNYYLAVVSEGSAPDYPQSRIGSGSTDYELRSLGPLAVQNLGVLAVVDLLRTNALEGGQLRAYQFTVSAGTSAVEISLENTVGNPVLAATPGGLPRANTSCCSIFDAYGSDGGQNDLRQETAAVVTFANPAPGTYSVIVKAASVSGNFADASYVLRVRKKSPTTVSFDGGASVVANQRAGSWNYFRVVVPTNILGWNVRLTNVTSGLPRLVVCRDLLPDFLVTHARVPDCPACYQWYYQWATTNWPSGYQWAADYDWTARPFPPDGQIYHTGRILAMGVGNPLEPGTYIVGVSSLLDGDPLSYTLVSRGIGAGQSIPVTELPFAATNLSVMALPAREAAYYHVVVPANSAGWKLKLRADSGESLLIAQQLALPNVFADNNHVVPFFPYGAGGRKMQKSGDEQFVVLPLNGTNQLSPGDYYLAVVSEGQNPNGPFIGEGSSDYTLQNIGELPVDDLGLVGGGEVTRAHSLEGGELRAYRFTVPEGVESVQIQLTDRIGNPVLSVRAGEAFPNREYYDYTLLDFYGVDGGQLPGRIEDDNSITIASPAAGTYSLIVKATEFLNASYTLHIQAVATQPLAFDGGTATIVAQAPDGWRYFRVEVPTNALGWDVRLTEVSSGSPRLIVRRDSPPDALATSGGDTWYYGPFTATNWPAGFRLAAGYDWTARPQSSDGSIDESGRILAMGLGNPVEPGTYIVGVINQAASAPMTYTIRSRGIGEGMSIPVVDVNYANGSATNSGLVAREAAYYRIVVPSNAPSLWLDLLPDNGEALMMVQQTVLPSVGTTYGRVLYPPVYYFGSGGRKMQKSGHEHFVLLPEQGQDFIPAGAYFVAAVSEGVNPSGARIGEGSSSYVLQSRGALPVDNLGAVTQAGVARTNALEAGEFRAFQFTIPAGVSNVEVSLTDRVGSPAMAVHAGTRIPNRYWYYDGATIFDDYGVDGGDQQGRKEGESFITLPNPTNGLYTLAVKARSENNETVFHDASYRLRVREIPILNLNFSAAFNTNGLSNAVYVLLADDQRAFYRVVVPATDGGLPVVGWKLDLNVLQGSASVRVRKDALPADGNIETSTFVTSQAIIVPPFLTPGTWFVEVRGSGSTDATLTSSALPMERSWTMFMNGQTNRPPGLAAPEFGDSGTRTNGVLLPGDHGIDLAQGKLHYYLVQVPTNNPGVLRVQLEAISGVPNLYIRTSAPPTLVHAPYYERALVTTGTEYANLVPPPGRYWTELTPGPWYLAVSAGGNANVRYRLRVSTGGPVVQDLALNGGGFTNQILAAGDWRYYRVAVPSNAPANWNINFQQQVGDVQMFVRDTVPPGQGVPDDNYNPVIDWRLDYKNHGPYPSFDAPGDHTFALPPVRPGEIYYFGFLAVNDATFSVSSSTSGSVLFPLINFSGGTTTNVLAPSAALTYRINVPADAARWQHAAVHSDQVVLFLEQGTVPWSSLGYYPPQHWRSYGPDSVLDQWLLYPNGWPWVPGEFYFLTVTNLSASPQPFSFTMSGSNTNFDGDGDGMADAWEFRHFGGLAYDGNGDQDHDGLSDLREFQLGTDPLDARSPGRFIARLPGDGSIELRYDGEPARQYRIEVSTNLLNWTTLTNVVPAYDPLILHDDILTRPHRFYRAVRLP